ncbi:thioredoxin domain-containing protein 6 isoform X2 [Syngnathoides biaculeatus]|uniref:thioredoxin domain-containing protein 6 isoform X2 n=1 Tax=Syngnathoides biaculeatus TaxID=300417 RepID=UPI002ADE923F|nr:thioredoxin domain-containing protein 6 isoform X2 [Syngnathoides biaculeatus]
MTAKRKETILQVSATNQEQWEEVLATKGLTVVDVYQHWCGPCRAVISLLRKINNELGDDLLHFATAEADGIDALRKYRGKCEPTFLFYGGGQLVGVLRGADAPLLQRMIVDQLAKEKLVLEHGGQRKVVVDNELALDEIVEQGGHQLSEGGDGIIVPASKSYTVAVIKPDAVARGEADEIITKIQDAGFEILARGERTLTEAQAREFYQRKATEDGFEDLVQSMSSGPSHILVLSKPDNSSDAVEAWLRFIGPADVDEARRRKPESLRAQYGTRTPFNAVHGSEDANQAGRELAFFFPDPRSVPGTARDAEEERVERTLALIRPLAAREDREEILTHIKKSGFQLSLQREVTLTEEQAREFYKHRVEDDDFPALLQSMTRGPVLALVLTREDAVRHWKNMLGPSDLRRAKEEDPECLRARFSAEGDPVNQLHGSQSPEEASGEISFFFPVQQTLAVIKPDAVDQHKDKILQEIRDRGFSIRRLEEKLLSRETAEGFYKEHRKQPFFSQLVEFMCSGPSVVMILEKENAVEEWRATMGPTDPDRAKAEFPDSLRARLALDVLRNSVHGSSSRKRAQEEIQSIFGEPTGITETSDEHSNEATLDEQKQQYEGDTHESNPHSPA